MTNPGSHKWLGQDVAGLNRGVPLGNRVVQVEQMLSQGDGNGFRPVGGAKAPEERRGVLTDHVGTDVEVFGDGDAGEAAHETATLTKNDGATTALTAAGNWSNNISPLDDAAATSHFPAQTPIWISVRRDRR